MGPADPPSGAEEGETWMSMLDGCETSSPKVARRVEEQECAEDTKDDSKLEGSSPPLPEPPNKKHRGDKGLDPESEKEDEDPKKKVSK